MLMICGMGRSVIHEVGKDGKTLCGRFKVDEVMHTSKSLRPTSDVLAAHTGALPTCRSCLSLIARSLQ